MNREAPFLTDDAIERGLSRRAPRGADAGLFDAVMAEVGGTPQVSRWGPPWATAIPHRRRAFVWVAIAAALATIIAGIALIGSGGSLPSLHAVITPLSPLPATIASRSLDPSSGLACATDTIRAVAIPRGTRTDGRAAFPGLGGGRVAFATTGSTGAGRSIDIEVVTGSDAPADVVATFSWGDESLTAPGSQSAFDVNYATVAPMPVGSRSVLVTIGFRGNQSLCTDLYLVAVDGSAVTMLSHYGSESAVESASLSPDGTAAASLMSVRDAGSFDTAFAIMDSHGAAISSPTNVCPNSRLEVEPAWSADGRRVALACSLSIDIFDVSASRWVSIADAVGNPPQAMQWNADGSLLIATTDPAAILDAHGNGGLIVWRLDPVAATWSRLARVIETSADWAVPFLRQAFSPDGRTLILNASGGQSGTDGGTWALDIGSSRLTKLLGPDQDATPDGTTWAADGSAFAYLDSSRLTVRRQPLDGSQATVVGVLPTSSHIYLETPFAMDIP